LDEDEDEGKSRTGGVGPERWMRTTRKGRTNWTMRRTRGRARRVEEDDEEEEDEECEGKSRTG
jgi:hypothetical protein